LPRCAWDCDICRHGQNPGEAGLFVVLTSRRGTVKAVQNKSSNRAIKPQADADPNNPTIEQITALAGKPVVNTMETHLKTNPVKRVKDGMIEAVTQWLKTHSFLKAA